eukprot:TRINITY_DN91798_c0_g1_i1.p1 TRINITY_DN91798_c0_g1~~TRINITY_DN91798_c0_g1_i1.p1  ORF type:complete len:105 (+),score=17.12 TRINITY_DN91798_c0_g1_i1:771-1085(+)
MDLKLDFVEDKLSSRIGGLERDLTLLRVPFTPDPLKASVVSPSDGGGENGAQHASVADINQQAPLLQGSPNSLQGSSKLYPGIISSCWGSCLPGGERGKQETTP